MKNVKASNMRRRLAAQELQETLASMTKAEAQAQPKKLKPTKRHYVKAVAALAVATVAGG